MQLYSLYLHLQTTSSYRAYYMHCLHSSLHHLNFHLCTHTCYQASSHKQVMTNSKFGRFAQLQEDICRPARIHVRHTKWNYCTDDESKSIVPGVSAVDSRDGCVVQVTSLTHLTLSLTMLLLTLLQHLTFIHSH